MAAPSDDSLTLSRLGRAGPTTSEIDLLRSAALDGGRLRRRRMSDELVGVVLTGLPGEATARSWWS